ncbi:hypothetical protein OVA14_10645 [Agrococcus sp. SL85]|uniref:hypothetical protein n=1 Tax=Agrococcus sp. SL85 TaxID=2995141 RepID=UPI00226D078E|nr:hypothetical protein [Agrococcus sp. SL85]WAC65776.1 hypothetical protein OVA14_10645 [Agrococcus sp. SL85]
MTALAPVAAALGALHAVGAAARGIALQDVRLDADGAPLLLAAGAAIETSAPTRAWRDASEAVARDVAAWRDVAEAVLDAAGAALPPAVETALAERDLAAAGEALLEAWPALPLALEPPRRAVELDPRAPMRRRDRSAAERSAGIGALWERVAALLDRALARGAARSVREPAAGAGAGRPSGAAAVLDRRRLRSGRARPRGRARGGGRRRPACALATGRGLRRTGTEQRSARTPATGPAVAVLRGSVARAAPECRVDAERRADADRRRGGRRAGRPGCGDGGAARGARGVPRRGRRGLPRRAARSGQPAAGG